MYRSKGHARTQTIRPRYSHRVLADLVGEPWKGELHGVGDETGLTTMPDRRYTEDAEGRVAGYTNFVTGLVISLLIALSISGLLSAWIVIPSACAIFGLGMSVIQYFTVRREESTFHRAYQESLKSLMRVDAEPGDTVQLRIQHNELLRTLQFHAQAEGDFAVSLTDSEGKVHVLRVRPNDPRSVKDFVAWADSLEHNRETTKADA